MGQRPSLALSYSIQVFHGFLCLHSYIYVHIYTAASYNLGRVTFANTVYAFDCASQDRRRMMLCLF